MNTNRLSVTLAKLLNEQMTNEAHAAQLYLSYGAWAMRQGFKGIATFLFKHAEEERNHMTKIMEYILNRGESALIVAIPAPPANPTDIHTCFEAIYTHEVSNTTAIYKVVKMSLQEEDWATWSFMQWFVKEQVEEETFAMGLIDKLRIVGNEKLNHNALFLLDQTMENGDGRPAEVVTAANP